MPLEEFRAMLQETRDSTIRTEEQVLQIREQLKTGDATFRAHDSRITKLEQAQRDASKDRDAVDLIQKKRGRIVLMILSALAIPAASTAWDKLMNFLKH